jgi:hypothetical protein
VVALCKKTFSGVDPEVPFLSAYMPTYGPGFTGNKVKGTWRLGYIVLLALYCEKLFYE